MPKIFDKPNEKKERGWEPHKRPVMGSGPAGPSAQTDNRINAVLIILALALMALALLYQGAWGEEQQEELGQPRAAQQMLALR